MATRTSQTQPKLSLQTDAVFAEAEFSRGIVRDIPRSSIPVGGVYDAVDFLVDSPGLLYKRGGAVYQGGELGTNTSGVGFVAAPEFPTGTRVFGQGADGNVYDLSAGGNDLVGALGIVTVDNPHLYVDRIIVPSADGITAPKKIYVNGTTPTSPLAIANLGGSPPPGRFITVHLSRVVLANTAAKPHRLFFSPAPDPEPASGGWNVNTAYIDTNHLITGITPCQGVLLVFSAGHTERIVGDIIPGEVGENMSVSPVGEVGCHDARSIVPWRGNVIFAGQGGIWVTNGVGFDSLIEKEDGSGISSYWREIFGQVAANNGVIAAGLLARDYYVLSLSYGTTLVDTLICYLPRKAWTRLSNLSARSFASAFTGADELYAGLAQPPGLSKPPILGGNRVVRLSPLLKPSSSNVNDHNGVQVMPRLQLRMIGEGIGEKAYGHGHLTYKLVGGSITPPPVLRLSAGFGIEITHPASPPAAWQPNHAYGVGAQVWEDEAVWELVLGAGFSGPAVDEPNWAAGSPASEPFFNQTWVKDPDGVWFEPVVEGDALGTTKEVQRRRFMVNTDAQTLNIRIVQEASSVETRIYALEQEVRVFNVTADSPG